MVVIYPTSEDVDNSDCLIAGFSRGSHVTSVTETFGILSLTDFTEQNAFAIIELQSD